MDNYVLRDQVVQVRRLHVEGAGAAGGQDLADPGEPELVGQDLVEERVVERVGQPLQPVAAHARGTEHDLHAAPRIARALADHLGGEQRGHAPLLQMASTGSTISPDR